MTCNGIKYTVRWGRVAFLFSLLIVAPILLVGAHRAIGRQRAAFGGAAKSSGHAIRQPAALSDGLVTWMRFDGDVSESGTTAHSYTASNFAGTSTSGYSSGIFGGSLAFDGVDDQVSLPDANELDIRTGSMTWSFWINMSSAPGSNKIIYRKSDNSNLNGFIVQVDSLGRAFIFVDNQSANAIYSTKTITDGRWHLVTSVLDRGTNLLSLYVDSTFQVSYSYAAYAATDFNSTAQALFSSNAAAGFTGSLDDFRIYNRALSTTEITTLYQGSQPVSCDQSCVGWWKLDEGTGTTTADSSPYAAGNGTLTNFGTSSTSGWVSGVFDDGLAFDGSNDYIDVGNAASYNAITTGKISVCVWIRPTSVAARGIIASNTSPNTGFYGFVLYVESDASLRMRIHNNASGITATGGTPIVAGQWQHVCSTYDGANVRLYINGKVLSNVYAFAAGYPSTAASYNLTIGQAAYTPIDRFVGVIDDLRIYNRPLADYEIADQYLAGR